MKNIQPLTDDTHHFPSIAYSVRESVVLQDFLKLQSFLNKLTLLLGVSLQSKSSFMASLIVLFCKCLPNLYKVHLNLYMYVYTVLFNIRFTSIQEPEVREHYISVMSDIVSFHSKRLEHLAIHFQCESYQLCMSIECNIFLLVLCEYH